VLIQDRLGHPGGLGHLCHRRGVKAAVGEHLEGDVQKLAATLHGRQAGL
jgi:hypothetical protein